jgi:hypothetical protein
MAGSTSLQFSLSILNRLFAAVEAVSSAIKRPGEKVALDPLVEGGGFSSQVQVKQSGSERRGSNLLRAVAPTHLRTQTIT